MRQVLQNLKNGSTELEDIPIPQLKKNHVIIKTSKTLISIGTEKTLVAFGKSNLIQKARQQPEKVRDVLNKIKTDGLFPTITAVKHKLDSPLPLGYSNVGIITEIGDGISEFQPGDRVISNGPHAEYVCISKNLVTKIPEDVSDEDATFTVVGSIGLQGIRLIQPQLGESFAVIGLGLIGLLTCQILQANGCQVIGIDIDTNKINLAEQLGIKAFQSHDTSSVHTQVKKHNNNQDLDGVIITASTTSNQPLELAATLCRKKGRIILVGVIGNEWSRSSFYKKELSFQVSCSYGPGRYDPNYEEKGLDYPLEYVRFTEKRNFDTMLQLLSQNKLQLKPLITKQIDLSEVIDFFSNLEDNRDNIGVLINYPSENKKENQTTISIGTGKAPLSTINIGFIGAGNFSKSILLPHIKALRKKHDIRLICIASSAGISANHLGKKYGFSEITTNPASILDNDSINTIFITTPHNTHAKYVIESLKKNKHVFVEKPLCLNEAELEEIKSTYKTSKSNLMIGFNRRFSSHIQKIKSILDSQTGPFAFTYTINAGFIPSNHWIQNPTIGGGRIIGEAVHFIDLLSYLANDQIKSISSISTQKDNLLKDTLSIQIKFKNNSIGTIHYFANGHKSFPKEQLSIFFNGEIITCDNFKITKGYGTQSFKTYKTFSQNKGYCECLNHFFSSIRNNTCPILFEDIIDSTFWSFKASAHETSLY